MPNSWVQKTLMFLEDWKKIESDAYKSQDNGAGGNNSQLKTEEQKFNEMWNA